MKNVSRIITYVQTILLGVMLIVCVSPTANAASIIAVTYSPDGKYVAAAGSDGTITIRDAFLGETVRTTVHSGVSIQGN